MKQDDNEVQNVSRKEDGKRSKGEKVEGKIRFDVELSGLRAVEMVTEVNREGVRM